MDKRPVFETRSPDRHWNELPVLLCFLAILAGVLALVLLVTPSLPSDDSPEAGFGRDMSVHHAQAVEMAEIVRQRTLDPEIRILATDVALTQQAQIGQIQGWLGVWGLPATGKEPPMTWMGHPTDGLMPGMATPTEVTRLSLLDPAELDVQFLRLMIPHHQAGIAMGEAILERTERPEVRALAEAIVTAQRAEIEAMQDLLARKGQPPLTTGEGHIAPGVAEEHGEGFTASVGPIARDTLRLAPLTLAVFAISWLGLDALSRRAGNLPDKTLEASPSPAWQAVAVIGLLASAALHGGLAPDHFEESLGYGLFFSLAAGGLSLAAAAVLAWPSRASSGAGVLISGALVVLYALFRLVAPPGSDAPEGVDLVGLTTKATEVLALIACAALWLGSRRPRGTEVRAGEPSNSSQTTLTPGGS